MENDEIRYLSEPVFRKILENSEILTSHNRYGVGFSETRYLILSVKGKLSEMRDLEETDQRRSWSRRYVRPISPGEAIDLFDLTLDKLEELPEKARKIFLDYLEEEVSKIEREE